MCDLPYIPLNISDFLSDDKVALMNTEEVGAYILLLCRAWQQDPPGTLPANDEYLSTWSKCSLLKWATLKPMVMKPFRLDGERWHMDRMIRDHSQVSGTLQKRREAAQKGADARWGSKGMRSQCDGNAKREKIKTKTKDKVVWSEDDGWGGVDDRISDWSDAYPNVDVKQELKAMNQWLVANPSKRKTQKGLPRFITAWLKRTNDKGSKNGNKATAEHPEVGLGNVIRIQ